MAIGGFLGSALAGLSGYDRAQQEAQQNQYRQIQQRMLMQEMQQRQQQERQQQEAMRLAYGGLGGLGGLGGAPPLQGMPQTPMPQMGGGQPDQLIPPQRTQSGQDMGGGMAAGGAATRSGYDMPALLRLASQAGFSPEAAPKMAAISMAESSGNPGAVNPKDPGGSYGLTQINAKAHGDQYAKAALDPNVAMKEAFDISKGGTDFSPWSTFKSGAYKQFLEKTMQGGQALGKQVAQDIPPMAQGRMGLAQMKEAIDKAAPDADGATKMMAIMQLHQMLAPYEKMQFQQYMKDNQNEFRAELQRHQQEFQDRERQEREKFQAPYEKMQFQQQLKEQMGTGSHYFETPQGPIRVPAGSNVAEPVQLPPGYKPKNTEEGKGWTTMEMTMPDGTKQPVRVQASSGKVEPLQLPGGGAGLTKVGTGQKNQPLSDVAADRYARIFQSSGYLPPGIARSSAAIAQIMNKTGDLGTPGEFVANMASRQADTKSLAAMTKLADAATSFENTAIRNFDQAIKYVEKEGAIPTDLGPAFNRWIMEGEKMFGDKSVPGYQIALLTAANEYAKVMQGATGAAGSTEGARREAYEHFSPYLSSGQIHEVVKVAKQEMENRREELYSGVDDIKNRLKSPQSGPMSRGHEPGASSAAPAASAAPAPQAGPQEGDTATNQATGEKLTYRNGQWVK